jgi:hypothetical protein
MPTSKPRSQVTVQTAFYEMPNGLIAHQRVRLHSIPGGVDTQLDALDADRDLFQAELDPVQIRLNESRTVVQLYKALGGGWQ